MAQPWQTLISRRSATTGATTDVTTDVSAAVIEATSAVVMVGFHFTWLVNMNNFYVGVLGLPCYPFVQFISPDWIELPKCFIVFT